MNENRDVERVSTLVIGGGQAGLAMGYQLAKRNLSFRILDAHPRVGDAWRNRWDSLRLFTPARYVGLPGFPFPANGDAFPTKDDIADYLESYAKRFQLPVQKGIRVEKVSKKDGRFVVEASDRRWEADQVVVAMANYQLPRIPAFAQDLDPDIVQLHSHNYRNPSQLRPGSTLIVGVGNSGADIAIEVSKTHPTWMSGKESGHVPFRIETFLGRNILFRLVRFIGHHVLSLGTPIGRKVRPKLLLRASPLVRVKPKDLSDAGVERVARVVGARNGRPSLADNRTLEIANVIWCTGYEPGFSWIDLPVVGADGKLMHERGVVHRVPGLYFLGLHFLYAMSSATLVGVGRDAEYIAKAIAGRIRKKAQHAVQPRSSVAAVPPESDALIAS
ncbi:MAG TPA: NAD(P)-binding domain-containing protein [Terriglobales bacterium]|nr:NAD(P)-binding domain-containing protein [Terriglobales bacterium]